ncbi:MAG: amidophosphoribosyltransferase [Sulfurospirillum sp. MES]|nr:MAG: amidophosphoribosyltransferase [Sulfurospirillum sp. MES]
MRCHLCLKLSWQPICKTCLQTLLAPMPAFRILPSGLKVYSFYNYSDIAPLLHTKHTYIGAKIFAQLGKHTFFEFLKTFELPSGICAVPIDDHVRHGYSHSAILAKATQPFLTPLYGSLRAQNHQSYSGKSRAFRQANKRDFIVTCKGEIDAILIDDIITTGSTLEEAHETLKKHGVNVLFALVLADAKEG